MIAWIDPAWAICVFLLAVRVGTFAVLSPLWGAGGVPVAFRVLIVLGLAALLASGDGVARAQVPLQLGPLAAAVVTEVVTGAILAFGVFAAFAAFAFAGKALDIQMGFGIGGVFDPATRAPSPVVGATFGVLAVALFFAMEGHHALLRGLAFSVEAIPPGTVPGALPITAVLAQFGAMFSLGLALAAPVLFLLLLVEVGLAALSRNLPQMNIFVLAIPVKILAGLAMLAASASYLGPVAGRIYASIFRYWEEALAHG